MRRRAAAAAAFRRRILLAVEPPVDAREVVHVAAVHERLRTRKGVEGGRYDVGTTRRETFAWERVSEVASRRSRASREPR